MVFKIKVNCTSAKNTNATFVENFRFHPKSPKIGQEILEIQKDHLFRIPKI